MTNCNAIGYVMSRSKKPKREGASPLGQSQRQLRVGELVRHAVASLLARGEVHDPVIEGHLITVPEVRMSPDLRLATVYVMPLAGRDADEVVAALERNKKYMRGEVAHAVNLKFAPDLRFHIVNRKCAAIWKRTTSDRYRSRHAHSASW